MPGYCRLNPSIELPNECKECYDNWPVRKSRYTRALCKRQNWIGNVDISHSNENAGVHENYNTHAVKDNNNK